MSPDPIFHPHMSPYVGMDDNPVALCDPYGLATGGDEVPKKKYWYKDEEYMGEVDPSPDKQEENNQKVKDGWEARDEKTGETNLPTVPIEADKVPWLKRQINAGKRIARNTLSLLGQAADNSDVINWIGSKYRWLKEHVHIAVKVKADIGLQGAIKATVGPVKGKAEINVAKVELGNISWDSENSFKGEYPGDGKGALVSNGASLQLGIPIEMKGEKRLGPFSTAASNSNNKPFAEPSIEAFYEQTQRVHWNGLGARVSSSDFQKNYGVIIGYPILSPTHDGKIKENLQSMDEVKFGENGKNKLSTEGFKSPQLKSKMKIGTDFTGLDLNFGAALGFGVDINVKLGYKSK